jgi:dTDP-glucose 4,6-dehydratase
MELAEMLVAMFPERGLKVSRRAPQQDSGYIASTFSRLIPDVGRLNSLGWEAKVDPKSGFKRMIEAYLQ